MRKSPPMRSLQESQWRKLSPIVGGILLVIAFFWLIQLLFFSTSSMSSLIPSNGQRWAPFSSSDKGHTSYQHLPVWMIWYQQVPQGGNGIAIDNQPNHDLYVFLDVKTGQEVLTIWS